MAVTSSERIEANRLRIRRKAGQCCTPLAEGGHCYRERPCPEHERPAASAPSVPEEP